MRRLHPTSAAQCKPSLPYDSKPTTTKFRAAHRASHVILDAVQAGVRAVAGLGAAESDGERVTRDVSAADIAATFRRTGDEVIRSRGERRQGVPQNDSAVGCSLLISLGGTSWLPKFTRTGDAACSVRQNLAATGDGVACAAKFHIASGRTGDAVPRGSTFQGHWRRQWTQNSAALASQVEALATKGVRTGDAVAPVAPKPPLGGGDATGLVAAVPFRSTMTNMQTSKIPPAFRLGGRGVPQTAQNSKRES